MQSKKKNSVYLFYNNHIVSSKRWAKKITQWLIKNNVQISNTAASAHTIIVLGGDGTILEAARTFQKNHPIILGLNLGRVGFLASVREAKNFLPQLGQFFNGDYKPIKHIIISVMVTRNKKKVFGAQALNEAIIQNPLGMLEAEICIDGFSMQHIRGTGVLVSTPTGSTAFNLSAHGPIIMPDIHCFIVTELLDHNIPTPSVVIQPNHTITVVINNFRKQGLLSHSQTNKPLDVILSTDGESIFPLQKGDVVTITRSPQSVYFAELEENYFLKSIQEKFLFQ